MLVKDNDDRVVKYMMEYIKLAEYNHNTYGLLTEFIQKDSQIVFAYTKFYNNKYTYEFVNETINNELIGLYLDNDR